MMEEKYPNLKKFCTRNNMNELEKEVLEKVATGRSFPKDVVMPVMTAEIFQQRQYAIIELFKCLDFGVDFGTIDGKPPEKNQDGTYKDKVILLKPGSEKAYIFFGLTRETHCIDKIEDWFGTKDGNGQPFLYYRLETNVFRNGILICVGTGSINSHEAKYKYRWVDINELKDEIPPGCKTRSSSVGAFTFQIRAAETTGQYAKPAEYWKMFQDAIDSGKARKTKKETRRGEQEYWEISSTQVRLANEDIQEVANTLLKMGKKRSEVDGAISACGLSSFVTQDLDEMEIGESWNPFSPIVSSTPEKKTNQILLTPSQQPLAGSAPSQEPARPSLVEPKRVEPSSRRSGQPQAALEPVVESAPQQPSSHLEQNEKENENPNQDQPIENLAKIDKAQLTELEALCKENGISAKVVSRWSQDNLDTKVSNATFAQYEKIKEFIIKGLIPAEKVGKSVQMICISKNAETQEQINQVKEEINTWITLSFGKRLKHLTIPELIKLQDHFDGE